MLAPLQARALLGLESQHQQYTDSDNGSTIGGGGGGNMGGGATSASPTNLTFPSNAALGGSLATASAGGGSNSNPFMLSMQSLNSSMKQQKRKGITAATLKQQQQDSDSELDEDEEGEDGREAEKAAFALESIAVAGRPSAVSLRHYLAFPLHLSGCGIMARAIFDLLLLDI